MASRVYKNTCRVPSALHICLGVGVIGSRIISLNYKKSDIQKHAIWDELE